MKRRERTVFDGIEDSKVLSPRVVNICPALIRAWEKNLADLDDDIARLMKCRAAASRNLSNARAKLEAINGKRTSHEPRRRRSG